MAQGTTKVGNFGYVAVVDKDGNVTAGGSGGGSSASGPQPAAQSTSVTPATDGAAFPLAGLTATAPAALGNNVRREVNLDLFGNMRSTMTGPPAAITDIFNSVNVTLQTNAAVAAPLGVLNYFSNGTAAMAARGDANGAYQQGNVASGTADSGNPVKVGGVVSAATNTGLSAGQRTNLMTGPYGDLLVNLTSSNAIRQDGLGANALVKIGNAYNPYNQTPSVLGVAPSLWNGSTYDSQRGDTNGAYVISKGGSNIATGQVSVGTTATLVAAARTGRQKITITPTSSTVFYVGNSGVSTTTGLYVAAGAALTLDTAAAIYAVGSAALTVSFIEYY